MMREYKRITLKKVKVQTWIFLPVFSACTQKHLHSWAYDTYPTSADESYPQNLVLDRLCIWSKCGRELRFCMERLRICRVWGAKAYHMCVSDVLLHLDIWLICGGHSVVGRVRYEVVPSLLVVLGSSSRVVAYFLHFISMNINILYR